jgi:hypothetical protein
MQMLGLFLFVLGAALLAYELIYPVLVKGSLKRLLIADLCLTAAAMAVVGQRFAGTGTEFDFGLFQTGWVLATLLCLFAVEAFLVPRYCRRFGIDPTKGPSDGA